MAISPSAWQHPHTPFKAKNLSVGSGATVTFTISSAGTGATVTFTVSTGALNVITTTPVAGGTGYPASTTIVLNVTGGGGTGGQVTATTNASGVVTAFSATPAAGGSGYTGATGGATAATGGILAVTTSPAAAGTGYPPSATIVLTVSSNGRTDGQVTATTDSSGTVTAFSATPAAAGTGYTATTGASTAKTGLAIKTTPGTLYGLTAINKSGADCYVSVFNAPQVGSVTDNGGNTVSQPTPGTTVPDQEMLISNGTQRDMVLPIDGQGFGAAITILSATAIGGGTGSATGVMVYGNFA